MNTEQVRRFVLDYLEATDCHIMETSPASVTVKLSERADRKLTNRPYYWGFVDRTGAEPETMRFTFVFDPSAMPPEPHRGPSAPPVLPPAGNATAPPTGAAIAPPPGSTLAGTAPGDSILGRYFGVAPAFTGGGGGLGRIPREDVTFGSRRLSSIMQAVHEEGRFIQLFAEPANAGSTAASSSTRGSKRSTAYEPWLLLNLNVEFSCDLKREEIHSFGISLVTGRIRTDFMEQLLSMPLSPKLPSNVHVASWSLSIQQAREAVERHLIDLISTYDDTWAVEASERLEEELARLKSYYEPQLQQFSTDAEQAASTPFNKDKHGGNGSDTDPEQGNTNSPSKQEQIQQQYDMRCQEIRWQFEPRIAVNILNAGLIHLPSTLT
ncbi:YqhG family protein [Paenibacillus sp. MER 180]|uniref:YqhG family protein n=1 Tax=unclassified Paenibacillus TaxID=185978 RepID=UPI0008065EEF|nr:MULTISPECIES: YqhG family protein [unclassified Paenibacillus]MCM3291404.1 YqhG family protein [Paenibacillus sp. MER 180]OBY77053.1 hypothetical protein BBG47_23690 [Paenibacillus sp. KS1]